MHKSFWKVLYCILIEVGYFRNCFAVKWGFLKPQKPPLHMPLRGKLNTLSLNVLRKHKGQKWTRSWASRELIALHTSFVKYQNSKNSSISKETDLEDSIQYEEGNDTYNYDQHDTTSSLTTHQRSYVNQKAKAAKKRKVKVGTQRIVLYRHSLDENTICLNCHTGTLPAMCNISVSCRL